MATLTTSFQKIATGSDTTYGGAKGHLELWAKYNSQSVETNKSNITVELRLVVDYGYIGNYQATYWSISGAVSNSGNLGSGDYRTRTLGSATGDIEHTSDGTKSISLSGSFNPTAWGYSMSVSGSADLPTIPRASSISSVTTTNIGSNATITVDRKSSSFTHTITYSFGSLSGTIVTKSPNTSISWTIPTTFYAQIPNSKTGNGTLTITTYNGNTQIGSSQTKTFTVSTSENACKPSLTNNYVIDVNTTTTAITGDTSLLISGFSTGRVHFKATPKNSATLRTVIINSKTVFSGDTSSYVEGYAPIRNFDATSIETKAIDSRGYYEQNTLIAGTDYTLIPYIPLTFNGSVGRDTPTGNALYITFSGKFYDHNLGNTVNSLTITVKWRRKGDSIWNNIKTLTRGTDYTVDTSNNTYSSGSGSSQSAIQLDTGYNYQVDYEIGVFYNDALVNTSVVLILTKGQPIVNWGEDYFNVNGLFKINGINIFDIIYPVGSYYETSNVNWTPQSAGWLGTWVEDTAGKTTVAKDTGTFSTVGNVVGSETKSYTPSGTVQNHTLTIDEIPSHNHTIDNYNSGGNSTEWYPVQHSGTKKGYPNNVNTYYTGGGQAHNHGFSGSSSSINVIQPSVVVRRWHRTA